MLTFLPKISQCWREHPPFLLSYHQSSYESVEEGSNHQVGNSHTSWMAKWDMHDTVFARFNFSWCFSSSQGHTYTWFELCSSFFFFFCRNILCLVTSSRPLPKSWGLAKEMIWDYKWLTSRRSKGKWGQHVIFLTSVENTEIKCGHAVLLYRVLVFNKNLN